MKRQTLWTYDFTVITIGSFVSVVGSTLSSFALSLVVLDYTGSTFLYILFNVAYQLPMLVCPVLAGPYLDRVSRKRVIWVLDFLSAGIYLGLFFLLRAGWFSYPVLLAGSILTGAIGSVYGVAYDSFYPNLITEGNFEKAYSISSLIYDLAALTLPLASALYQWLGSAAPLFAIDAASFFAAACFELTIRCKEKHLESASARTGRSAAEQLRRELREGLNYIRGEKGLLMIVFYFTAVFAAGDADQLMLPYFRNHADRFAAWPVSVETLYAVLANFMVAGRLAGGVVQYKLHISKERRFAVERRTGRDLLHHPFGGDAVLCAGQHAGAVQRRFSDAHRTGQRGRKSCHRRAGGGPAGAGDHRGSQCAAPWRGLPVHLAGQGGCQESLQPGSIRIIKRPVLRDRPRFLTGELTFLLSCDRF